MTEHLTELDLETARTGEADRTCEEHLAVCAQCRARLGFLEELAEALSQPAEPIEIPDERDQAILAVIQDRAAQAREKKSVPDRTGRMRRALPWVAAFAVAAGIALAIAAPVLNRLARTPETTLVAAGPDDLNRDGRVDILDAFALARSVKSKSTLEGKDPADAERIARIAVTLDPGAVR